jgi:hypothetical protein
MSTGVEPEGRGGTVWDWANQQVVKGGEGPGINTPPQGETKPSEAAEPDAEPVDELDEMTKDDLLAMAQDLGISPANASMNKDELNQAIRDHEA